MKIFSEIRDRHVLQAVGVYVGASWVLVEIFDRLVERYLLSPTLTDVVFWGLFSLIPAVILIAWTHGKPGKDNITRAEIVGVPINLIATTGLLMTVFSGSHLGATADRVLVTTEDGEQVERYVPKRGQRRNLTLFFWDNAGGQDSDDWLQYAIADLLANDLSQNPYIAAKSAYDENEWGFYQDLARAGHADGLDVPVRLAQQVAQDQHADYFIQGVINRSGTDYQLEAKLLSTGDLSVVQTYQHNGDQIIELIDDLSGALLESLDVPVSSDRIAMTVDIPSHYSNDTLALQDYYEARNALLFDNDYVAAIRNLDEALADDPSFVIASIVKVELLANQGRVEESLQVARQALTYDYKLPQRRQDLLKTLIYRLSADQEKERVLLAKAVELEPDDTATHLRLALHDKWSGNLTAAIEAYKQVLALDPDEPRALNDLVELELAFGNDSQALAYARRYSDLRPDDYMARVKLGDIYRWMGQRSQAREVYEEAHDMRLESAVPLLRLADLSLRDGDMLRAEQLLAEAEVVADSPQHNSWVLNAHADLLMRQGRLQAALEMLDQARVYEEAYNTPVEILFGADMLRLGLHLELGQASEAESILDSGGKMLQPPYDQFLQLGYAYVHAARENYGDGEGAVQRFAQAIQQFDLAHMQHAVDSLRGMLAYKQADYQRSAGYHQAALDKLESSVGGGLYPAQIVAVCSELARVYTLSGDLDAAREILDKGFQLDASNAVLWLERARLQWQLQQSTMAEASLNYAMAIWERADSDYVYYRQAQELIDEISS